MLNIFRALTGGRAPRRSPHRRRAYARPLANVLLEELESRLAPASFAINSQLQITSLGEPGALATGVALRSGVGATSPAPHSVVFFESAVANYQVLLQGVSANTDAVVLDSSGDGVKEIAAFLTGYHNLASIGVVAHGAPGEMALGTATLDVQSLSSYTRELAVVGSALGRGGELDLWSCDVAAGIGGESLNGDLAAATGAGVAAAAHPIGSPTLGGDWQLDVRTAGARGGVPFDASAIGDFHHLLGTWTAAASMATARGGQTATLLQNGKVLVAGGFAANAELYDPVSNTWSSAGSMATGLAGQTATLLQNGMVLVAGGVTNGTSFASAELYDPISNTWSSAGSMATSRWRAAATLLSNGQVLVMGGDSDDSGSDLPVSSAELYDPASNTWSSAGSMASGRIALSATLLTNGKVLVAGGGTGGLGTGGPLSSAELYDPVNNTWSSAASMATARTFHKATLLANGKVLVEGGTGTAGLLSSAELYDPVSNTWSSAGAMASARDLFTATLLNDGTVLVAGGSGTSGTLSGAELYNPLSNTWSSAGSLASTRYQFTATLLNNGTVLVAGGRDTSGPLSGAELYNPGLAQATQLVISNLSSTSITAGGTVSFTVTAMDSAGHVIPNYTGAVQLTSSDSQASAGGTSLPSTYTFQASDNGSHTFTVTLATAGSQTITIADQANSLTATTSPITVAAGPFSKFALNVIGGNTVVAGTSFLLTAQAADAYGNPVSGVNVPTTITASASPADPRGNFPTTAPVNSSGFAFMLGNLQTAGPYTITAGGGSTNVIVVPASANYFTVTAPASATTGTPFNVTVNAFDRFGNPATGYSGTVNITSTDPAASNLLSAPYTFVAGDNGVHTFPVILNSSTLGRAGTTIIVRDMAATAPPVSGFSAPVTVQGLVVVGTPQPTATGFTVTFSKPFVPADLTMYGLNNTTVQDVTMTGAHVGKIIGTLYVDPTTPSTLVFKASNAYLQDINLNTVGDKDSVALPDDTYTVTLKSGTGTNGFVDVLGNHLDGAGIGGSADYTQTFATTFQDDAHASASPVPVLAIPDFARGPDSATTITVPILDTGNNATHGIPITLYNAAGVTDATFTLTYNPQLLTPTAGGTGDSTVAGSIFTMGTIASVDSTHSTVSFIYHNATAKSGTVILGDITATVPSAANAIYKTKELLALSGITVTGGAPVQAADGVHVDAYVGDVHVTALPAIDASDALDAQKVASGPTVASGFPAYGLLDPAIIGAFVPGSLVTVGPADVTALFSKAIHLPVTSLPSIPAAVTTVSVSGADPTLSLVGAVQANGIVSVQVMLDHPHPAGSTGMTEAHLALTYDPSALSVSASDITLGSIPGAGWRITSEVDAATGQIGINLFNLEGTPITATQAGSLVNIAFHVVAGDKVPRVPVQLVDKATPNGQRYVTEVDDDQGPLTLSPDMDRVDVWSGWKSRTRVLQVSLGKRDLSQSTQPTAATVIRLPLREK